MSLFICFVDFSCSCVFGTLCRRLPHHFCPSLSSAFCLKGEIDFKHGQNTFEDKGSLPVEGHEASKNVGLVGHVEM